MIYIIHLKENPFSTEEKQYSAVAMVEANSPKDAFIKTQNLGETNWVEKHSITDDNPCRSTMMGDIFEEIDDSNIKDVKTKYYKLTGLEFEITNSPYEDLVIEDELIDLSKY